MPPGWQHTALCESGTVRAQKLLVKKGKRKMQDRANAARRNLRAAIPRQLREDWRELRHWGAGGGDLAIGWALRPCGGGAEFGFHHPHNFSKTNCGSIDTDKA